MDRKAEEPNTADKLKLEKKYIRLQEVGVSCWVSIPLAVFLLDHFDLAVHITLVMVPFILVICGLLCLEFGEEKRDALRRDSDNAKQGGDDANSN